MNVGTVIIKEVKPFRHSFQYIQCITNKVLPVYFANVRHCILKQHQIHCRVQLVVAVEGVGQDLVQALPLLDGHVLRLADAPGDRGNIFILEELSVPQTARQ